MLSGVILAQNNENSVGPVLDQLTRLVDEVVFVDGGSKDSTPDIARGYDSVRFFERSFDDNFAAQRNFALSKVQGSWIFSMDTDELLSSVVEKWIPYLIRIPFITHYRFPRYWLVERDGEYYYCVSKIHYPDYQTRLFRNISAFRYVDEKPVVHEFFPKKTRDFGRKLSSAHIFHFCLMEDLEKRKEKIRRYTEIEQKERSVNLAYIWERDDVMLKPLPELPPDILNI